MSFNLHWSDKDGQKSTLKKKFMLTNLKKLMGGRRDIEEEIMYIQRSWELRKYNNKYTTLYTTNFP